MPIYIYSAIKNDGTTDKDKILATSLTDAMSELEKNGLLVTRISRDLWTGNLNNKIPDIQLYQFIQEFIAYLKAGMTITAALESIVTNKKKTKIQQVLLKVYKDLIAGVPLTDAFEKSKDSFDDALITAIHNGEQSGLITEALINYNKYLKKKIQIANSIKSALVYPIFLLFALVIVVVALFVFVVPSFSELFDSFGAELPYVTRLVMQIADNVPYIVLVGIVLWVFSIAFGRYWERPKEIDILLDKIVATIPIIGGLKDDLDNAKINRSLSVMLESGGLLTNALDLVVSRLERNRYYPKMINVRDSVVEGGGFAEALGKNDLFSDDVLKMIQAGENSGQLSEIIMQIAEYYEDRTEQTFLGLSKLFEPVMMLLIGVIIGFVIISMYLPIFQLAEVVK